MDFPKELFKYRSWRSDHGRQILVEERLYFASAESFNDPFEAVIPLRYDLGTEEQVRALFLKHAPNEYPGLAQQEYESLADDYIRSRQYRHPERIAWYREYQYQKNIRDFGICSLAANEASMLMWGHYADSHHGYCICLDVASLLHFRDTSDESRRVLFDLYPVQYTSKFPVLNPYDMTREEMAVLPLTIKSDSWSYEKEYRLISLNGAGLTMQLDEEIISKIYLGCKMPAEHKKEITDVLRSKDYRIELWQAKINEELFGLYFESINY